MKRTEFWYKAPKNKMYESIKPNEECTWLDWGADKISVKYMLLTIINIKKFHYWLWLYIMQAKQCSKDLTGFRTEHQDCVSGLWEQLQ